MGKDMVSVIMATYNGGEYLAASIGSILCQTYANLELLISDDGSTEQLAIETLQEYARKDSRVKVEFLQGHHGPAATRNNAIRRATGRYIAFCDSDDRWMPQKLERQIALMEAKGCALSSSSYIICDAGGRETGISISPREISLRMLKHDNKIGCLTAVYDIQRLGRKFYMPLLAKRQDWALFLDILQHVAPAYALTEPLAYYRQRSNSLSSNKLSLVKYNVKVYETVFGFSHWKAIAYFTAVFMPCHLVKVAKRLRDSQQFMAGKHRG